MSAACTVSNTSMALTLTVAAHHLSEAPEDLERRAQLRIASGPSAARSPLPHLHRLWELVSVQRAEIPLPGLVGGAVGLEPLGPYGFAILTAADGERALQLAAQSFALINEGIRPVVVPGRVTRLQLDNPAPERRGAAISEEAVLSHFVSGLRRVAGVRPLQVHFRHAPPRYARRLSEVFEAAIVWSSHFTGLTVEQENLRRPPPLANAETHRVLCEHLNGELRALPSRSGRRGAVLRRLVEEPANASASQLADALGMSPRTLRRSLSREGAGFRQLRDRERAEQARRRLDDGRESITEVALTLGFSDSSTFARAFRRWFGESPRQCRRNLKARPTKL